MKILFLLVGVIATSTIAVKKNKNKNRINSAKRWAPIHYKKFVHSEHSQVTTTTWIFGICFLLFISTQIIVNWFSVFSHWTSNCKTVKKKKTWKTRKIFCMAVIWAQTKKSATILNHWVNMYWRNCKMVAIKWFWWVRICPCTILYEKYRNKKKNNL